jgi:hypothetical protein
LGLVCGSHEIGTLLLEGLNEAAKLLHPVIFK